MKQKTIVQFEKDIARLKSKILEIGAMRPGSLTQQVRRREDGEVYGRYWQLSYSFRGKGHTEYVPDDCHEQIAIETTNYQTFRRLSENLIELSIERSREIVRQAKSGTHRKSKPTR